MSHLKLTKGTYSARAGDIQRRWYVVDADGEVLGRLATNVACVLRGKHKTMYTPSMDTGDHVIVVNAGKIAISGLKSDNKKYYRHTGYPGGLKETPYAVMAEKKPEQIVVHAVKGMLPHNRLGRAMVKKLHVYAGLEHPHGAQRPEPLEIKG